MQQTLTNIRQIVKDKSWSYPHLVQLLKKAGIVKYTVDMKTYNVTYFNADGSSFSENRNDSGIIGAKFDSEAFNKSLQDHQQGKISFEQRLNQTRLAGVTYYEANFSSMTIVYYGNGGSYTETIPTVSV